MRTMLSIFVIASLFVFCGGDNGEEAAADVVSKLEITVVDQNSAPVKSLKVEVEVKIKLVFNDRSSSTVTTTTDKSNKLTSSEGKVAFTYTNVQIPETNYVTLKVIRVYSGVTLLYEKDDYNINISDGSTEKITIPVTI